MDLSIRSLDLWNQNEISSGDKTARIGRIKIIHPRRPFPRKSPGIFEDAGEPYCTKPRYSEANSKSANPSIINVIERRISLARLSLIVGNMNKEIKMNITPKQI
jgi:hypothetical protein